RRHASAIPRSPGSVESSGAEVRNARWGGWRGSAEGAMLEMAALEEGEQRGREPAGAGSRDARRVNAPGLPTQPPADGNPSPIEAALKRKTRWAESLQVQGRATRRAEG